MKILVVGGAGYIGSHVTRALLDKGDDVTVFDNLSSGLRENLFPEATFVHGDILNYEQLRQVMQGGFDAFVHLAAFKAANESMTHPSKYSVNNISGTINLLNAAVECSVKNVVFSSSAAIYGEPEYVPMDENHPAKPENYYGFTKLEIERFLYWYDKLKGLRFAALRYFNAAGYDVKGRICGLERNPQNLLPIVMEVAANQRKQLSIYGNDYNTPDGTCIRDYVHVNDLADGHVKALNYIVSENKSLTVNLGSENGISVKQMVEIAREVTGKAIPSIFAPRREGDPAKVVASSGLAKKLLNWEAHHSDVRTLVSSTWQVYPH
ncbi:MAG: UDP-glucose 4-epimerase GalE [Chitinispirillaceae bacterium]|nr:UDP-glucose 4-epimerase GalE [Chitinispirillaceae bacterium]